MLFTLYPALLVTLPNGETKTITDIFRRVSVDMFSNNYAILQEVTIPDGFTPEHVADKFYGRADYHWIILVMNEIVDVRKEWPMFDADLIEYAKKKYGPTGIYEVHHYRTTDGDKLIVDYDAADLTNGVIEAITNLQHEEELNYAKREIKILRPEYLAEFISSYTNLVR